MTIPTDKAGTLQQQYRARFDAAAAYRDALWQVLCREVFQRRIPPDATVLDLGCGWGEFSNNIRAGHKYAMDLNPDAAARLGGDVELLLQDCSQPWPLSDASLDVVFTSNFLEHLPDKHAVEATVRHAWRALKPGGKLICLGPNGRLLPGAYWDFWDHHVMITDRSLAELLELSGFTVTERYSHFLPYTMSQGRNPPLWLVQLYLRLPLAWRLLGKQFLLVADKGQAGAGRT